MKKPDGWCHYFVCMVSMALPTDRWTCVGVRRRLTIVSPMWHRETPGAGEWSHCWHRHTAYTAPGDGHTYSSRLADYQIIQIIQLVILIVWLQTLPAFTQKPTGHGPRSQQWPRELGATTTTIAHLLSHLNTMAWDTTFSFLFCGWTIKS